MRSGYVLETEQKDCGLEQENTIVRSLSEIPNRGARVAFLAMSITGTL
jgi:hypothetical protein